MSCGVHCRPGSNLVLLWPWCRPGAVALIWPLAWEPPCAAGTDLKKKKKKKKDKRQWNMCQNTNGPTAITHVSGGSHPSFKPRCQGSFWKFSIPICWPRKLFSMSNFFLRKIWMSKFPPEPILPILGCPKMQEWKNDLTSSQKKRHYNEKKL